MYKLQLLIFALSTLFSASCGTESEETTSPDTASSADAALISDEATTQDPGSEDQDIEAVEEDTSIALSPLAGPCETTEDCAPIGEIGTVCINNQLIAGLGLDVEAEIPNGYCSNMTCKASQDCGDEKVECIDLKASGENIPFNVCVQSCSEGSSECGEGQQCYCDADQGIFNTEGQADFCSCLPDLLIELIAGG